MPLLRRHRLWQIAVDAALIAGAWYLAFTLRFDKGVPPLYDHYWRRTILIVVGVKLGILLLSGWYVKWWRYISLRDVQVLARSVVFASVVLWIAFAIFPPVGDKRLPLGVAVLDLLLTLMGLAGVARGRALADRATAAGRARARRQGGPRGRRRRRRRPRAARDADDAARGLHADRPGRRRSAQAPHAAARREGARHDAPTCRACCASAGPTRCTSRSPRLPAQRATASSRPAVTHGVPVQHAAVGARAASTATRPGAPAARGAGRGRARTRARAARPGGDRGLRARPRRARDRRRRLDRLRALPPARAHRARRASCCSTTPRTNLFQIERELLERGVTNIVPVIGDVQGRGASSTGCSSSYRPAVVFHAAAYKHVPLMEANPVEAVRNNAIATRTVARVAATHGVDRFVLISTDKAVNAQTVMGATKALCRVDRRGASREDRSPMTRSWRCASATCSARRARSCPIFRAQIAAGGPVTVTHPEMTRYFMTIPEAAQLVRAGRRRWAAAARSSCSTWASRCGSSTSRAT